jgi:hypothetical protein
MNDLPLMETAGSLSIIFGGGLTALALLRREWPSWLGFLCLVVYSLLGWYSV